MNNQIGTRQQHLQRVFLGMVSAGLLVVWMQSFLLEPLKDAEVDMANMDPSDILKVPYPLERLQFFVLAPTTLILFMKLIQNPQKLFSYIVAIFRFSVLIYGLMGLCGAHIVEHYQESGLTAIYTAALVSTTFVSDELTADVLNQIPIRDMTDMLSVCRFYGMAVGCLPFQLLLVLDKGMQTQRWPIPVILGVTLGYVVGSIMGLILMGWQRKTGEKRK
jgi:hypothetical protein